MCTLNNELRVRVFTTSFTFLSTKRIYVIFYLLYALFFQALFAPGSRLNFISTIKKSAIKTVITIIIVRNKNKDVTGV